MPDAPTTTIEPVALDARGVVERLLPGAVSLRTWRSLDAGGLCPRGHRVGSRKLWLVGDVRAWAALGFPASECIAAVAELETGQRTPLKPNAAGTSDDGGTFPPTGYVTREAILHDKRFQKGNPPRNPAPGLLTEWADADGEGEVGPGGQIAYGEDWALGRHKRWKPRKRNEPNRTEHENR